MSNGFIMGILAEEEAGKGGENIISNFLKKVKVNVNYIYDEIMLLKKVLYMGMINLFIYFIFSF